MLLQFLIADIRANILEIRRKQPRGTTRCAAVVLTTRGETVVVFLWPDGKVSFFDSHGAPSLGLVGAYYAEFANDRDVCNFLESRFAVDPSVTDVPLTRCFRI